MSESTRSSGPPNNVTFDATKKSALNPTKKKQITVLLIGESGSGKTAFKSLLVNLFQGNAPLEMVNVNGPNEESGLTGSRSQTTRATRYIVNLLDGTQVHILDTPRLADTAGVSHGSEHLKDISNLIEAYRVDRINAVLILADGRNERLNVSSEYALGIFAALFPHKVTRNIGFMLTNGDVYAKKFNIDTVQEELRNSPSWFINNPLGILKDLQKKQAEGPMEPSDEEWLVSALNRAYNGAVDELNSCSEWFDGLKPEDELNTQDIKAVSHLCETAVQIESKIDIIAANSVDSTERQKLKDARDRLDEKVADKARLEKSKEDETKPRWIQDPTTRLNTVCNAPECHSNCHKSCMTIDKSQPDRCLVFYEGKCDTCGHPANKHLTVFYVHDLHTPKPNPKTISDLEKATKEEKDCRDHFEDLNKKITDKDKTRSTALAEMNNLLKEFNQLSLSKNFASHINSTIDLLKARKEKLSKEPNTEKEQETIDSTVEKLQSKLKIIQGNTSSNE